jgi:hypothetical protein
MSDNVIEIKPKIVEGSPDHVFKTCMGGFDDVIVVGYDDGYLKSMISSELSIADVVYMLEALKASLLSPQEED